MNTINYKNITDSQDFYQNLGYKNIEIPWYVTQPIMDITKPDDINSGDYYLKKNDKVLVASGEQSFLYLMVKGILTEGYYQGVTPCFRFEKIDSLHRKTFMKNELIYASYNVNNDLNEEFEKILGDAKTFFKTKLNDNIDVVEVKQSNSIINYDLEYNGYELGSYGIRTHMNMKWVYGTGCAEPRLSFIEKIKKI